MSNKVFIDALGIHRVGGGRTSIHTLLDHMFRLDRATPFVVLVSAHEPGWDEHGNVEQRVIKGNRIAVRALLQCRLPVWVRQEQAALVHFTKNLGIFGLSCPYVVTVHDLTTLLFQEQFSALDVAYWKFIQPLTVRGAAQVVAVSNTTAEDVERFYGVPSTEIEVIHWASHPRFSRCQASHSIERLRRRYGLPSNYVLFLGILAKKKNLPTLLRSLARLRARRAEVPDLVVVGRPYCQSEDQISKTLVHELGLDDHVHFVGAVPDKDLPLFYRAADLYVLPSFHEGFGIPCLEAMACGTPVITTQGGALPEVVADAALLLDDPEDVAGLSAAMERLLCDTQLRQYLIKQGLKRADAFSWKASAQKMLDIYRSTLGD